MGRIWMPGVSDGADLDAITAAAGDVLKGKVIVDKDGNPLTGLLELTGSAADSQVLAGKTYYNTDAKTKRTGTMPNQGAVAPSGLNAGGSYTIPAGYHNGQGKVTANSLAGQTDSTAAAGDILSGKTAWVKGNKVAGAMANKGAVTGSVNCGGTYTIPAGYHNGSGKVTGNSLASQTGVQSGKTAAGAGQILTGYEAWVNGGRVTGTMANQGKKEAALNCGGSYTIPAGFHNGQGKVTANALSGQTDATAAAGDILSGKTAWVKGSKITGAMATMAGQTITPSQAAQTVSCNGKKMTGNIVVNSIPLGLTKYSKHFSSDGSISISTAAIDTAITTSLFGSGSEVRYAIPTSIKSDVKIRAVDLTIPGISFISSFYLANYYGGLYCWNDWGTYSCIFWVEDVKTKSSTFLGEAGYALCRFQINPASGAQFYINKNHIKLPLFYQWETVNGYYYHGFGY